MKKFLIIVIISILLGSAFAFYMFYKVDKTFAQTIDTYYINVFQIGAFSNYDNALKLKELYSYAVIKKNKEYYEVYAAISFNTDITNSYANYFNSKNISYYLKKINISSECLDHIRKYESLLKKSNISNNYENSFKNILKYYTENCND